MGRELPGTSEESAGGMLLGRTQSPTAAGRSAEGNPGPKGNWVLSEFKLLSREGELESTDTVPACICEDSEGLYGPVFQMDRSTQALDHVHMASTT